MLSKGRLIVLEGIDGSGKSSQYRRICARMEKDGIDYNHIVFPRYDKESSALIRMYLSGQFGTHPDDVNAYAASTFYAVDRFASFREDWGKIYNNGGLIISDRYTTSNAVHQGSKLSDEELPAFFRWLSDLEYVKMGLPKPDLVIYLEVDLETGRKNQIRVHMADMGHPIAGDRQYGARTRPLGRLCLHAHELTLTDPRTGGERTFSAKEPAAFRRLCRGGDKPQD